MTVTPPPVTSDDARPGIESADAPAADPPGIPAPTQAVGAEPSIPEVVIASRA